MKLTKYCLYVLLVAVIASLSLLAQSENWLARLLGADPVVFSSQVAKTLLFVFSVAALCAGVIACIIRYRIRPLPPDSQ